MTAWGIVVAAGRGIRFGGAKHARPLAGRPLYEWARRCLLEGGAAEVIVVGDVPGGVAGGARRRDSVAAGLARVPAEVRWVLVHDAARPLASPALVRAVLARLEAGGADGVVPALAVRDALKRVDGDTVAASVDRSSLVTVQTPQGFDAGVLRRAHEEVPGDAADDAELVTAAGGVVVTVPGEGRNLKITYPEDLALAEALAP